MSSVVTRNFAPLFTKLFEIHDYGMTSFGEAEMIDEIEKLEELKKKTREKSFDKMKEKIEEMKDGD